MPKDPTKRDTPPQNVERMHFVGLKSPHRSSQSGTTRFEAPKRSRPLLERIPVAKETERYLDLFKKIPATTTMGPQEYSVDPKIWGLS